MNEEFKEKIKNHTQALFYNSEGNTDAYKLCIRHISAAMSAGVARLENGYMIPHDVLYLVDLDREIIEEHTQKVKVVALEFL